MRWRLLAAFLGVVAVMLVAQDVPLVAHLRRVERDRLLTGLERDAFIVAGQAASALALARRRDGARRIRDGTAADRPGRLGDRLRRPPTAGRRHRRRRARGRQRRRRGPAGGDDLARPAGDRRGARRRAGLRRAPDGSVSLVRPGRSTGADAVGAVRISHPASGSTTERRPRCAACSSSPASRSPPRGRGAVHRRTGHRPAAPAAALRPSSVAAGEFDVRVDDDRRPARGAPLAGSFNAMTARLARLVEQQQRFAGDASHQLRTPLTALRLQLERTTALVEDPAAARRCATSSGAGGDRPAPAPDRRAADARPRRLGGTVQPSIDVRDRRRASRGVGAAGRGAGRRRRRRRPRGVWRSPSRRARADRRQLHRQRARRRRRRGPPSRWSSTPRRQGVVTCTSSTGDRG